jgi:hypothetical protein
LIKIDAPAIAIIDKSIKYNHEDTLRGHTTNNMTMKGSIMDNYSPNDKSSVKTDLFDSPGKVVLKFVT